MKRLANALRLIWLLVSTTALALVIITDLRYFVPAGLLADARANRVVGLVLAWPEQRFWPLVFVVIVVLLDVAVVATALRAGINLTELLRQKPSPAKARTLLRLGEVRAAADTYLDLGSVEKAADLLADRGYLLDAGRMLIDHGMAAKADRHLARVEGRDSETAAGLLEKNGQADAARELYRRAATFFAEQRDIGRAGRCFFKAGEAESARRYLADNWADIFKPDAPHEVADMLSAVGAHRDAGLAYARAAQAATDIETGRRYAKKAAALFAKGGDPGAGAALLERSSLVADAAELYAHAGQIDKAVELLRSIKSGVRAAEILLKVGQTERAVDLYVEAGEVRHAAQVALQSGNFRTGALLLERVGDIDGAAQLLEQGGELLEAAEMMRNAGNTMRAAVLYERAGALGRAGSIYEAAGEEMRAASLYARGGEGVASARLYLKSGRIREASQSLGGVVTPESRPLHAELGARFAEIGESGLALEHLMAAIAGSQLDYVNAGIYFHLGLLYEKLGDEATALDVFRKVAAVNPRIPDLAARIQVLQAKVARQAPAATASKPGAADSRHADTVGMAAIASESGLTAVVRARERYKIEAELGKGAMGRVVKAFDQILHRGVALKVLPDALANNKAARTAFIAEARAAAALKHPNIVTLYDVGTDNDVPYIAMELVEGSDLATHVKKEQAPLVERLRLLIEVADALDAAHRRGIVHRDIKPGNILVDRERHVRLVDFGIARAMGSVERGGKPVGTPFYMSPEQARGLPIDLRTDIYSLGVVIFEICSGRRPFEEGDVIAQHLAKTPPPLRAVDPSLPAKLEHVVAACLAKEPDGRPKSAAQVRVALESIARECGGAPA